MKEKEVMKQKEEKQRRDLGDFAKDLHSFSMFVNQICEFPFSGIKEIDDAVRNYARKIITEFLEQF